MLAWPERDIYQVEGYWVVLAVWGEWEVWEDLAESKNMNLSLTLLTQSDPEGQK
jgi:hypothetical protein